MQRLIIDTDPGVDDAQAILMAAAYPGAKIEAILTVGGNVGIEHTTRNALTIVEAVGQDIPVYSGCDAPLIRYQEDAAWVHGKDGLGDAGLVPRERRAESTHAALALIRMVNREPGELTLVAIGPLTNIAVALKIDPSLPHKIKRFVDMGGAVTGRGNTSLFTSEFNIYYDPEAAYIVFEAWEKAGKQIEVVDWEATVRHGVSANILDRWMALETPRARFFQAFSRKSLQAVLERMGRTTFFGADPLAMSVALEPDIVRRAESHYLVVEYHGIQTRGQTTVDWQDRSGKSKNARIVLDVDLERFCALFEAGLR